MSQLLQRPPCLPGCPAAQTEQLLSASSTESRLQAPHRAQVRGLRQRAGHRSIASPNSDPSRSRSSRPTAPTLSLIHTANNLLTIDANPQNGRVLHL
eukprot:141955-Chlamydomonas_euryale.AAC.3